MEFERGRSVFEWALRVAPYRISLWNKYFDTELLYKNINHAIDVIKRATFILPKVN